MEDVHIIRNKKNAIKTVLFTTIILAFVIISMLEDIGQFIKFLLFDVIAVNVVGIVLISGGLFALIFGVYMIISRKAVNPRGMIIPIVLLSSILLILGFLLAKNTTDDLSDVGSYLSGNVREENVVITEFQNVSTPDGPLYYYTFEDGRTFEEGYRGKGFNDVIEGESYTIRYLPKTKKLLRIEKEIN